MPHHMSGDRARRLQRGGSATRFAARIRRSATCVTFCLALAGAARPGAAAELAVSVVEPSGRAVADVVVTVVPAAGAALPPPAGPRSAVMDQRNRAFVPRVLAIATGTRVEFPNNDDVSHQVYSFSPAKRFQLPLYKGARHPPVSFEQPGLVVLGCNIHDEMVGYIYVTDAPWFGTTGPDGTLAIPAPAPGDYRISLWSPLIADSPGALTQIVHVDAAAGATARIQLTRPLRARPEPRPRRGDWEY